MHDLPYGNIHYKLTIGQHIRFILHDLRARFFRYRHKWGHPRRRRLQRVPCRLLLGGKLGGLHALPDWHLHHGDGEHFRGGVHDLRAWILRHVHKQ